MVWIIAIVITVVMLFFLTDMGRMMRKQSRVRTAYREEGLTDEQANKVAWYLIDMFIYMRKHKDPKLAKLVMNSTMTVFRQRLYKNEAYEGRLAAKMQVDGIRDACLIFDRPAIEAADLMYSSVVASHEQSLKQRTSE